MKNLIFLSLFFFFGVLAQATPSNWNSLMTKALEEQNLYYPYNYYVTVRSSTNQADYIIIKSTAYDDNGGTVPSYVYFVHETWTFDSAGNRIIDQWIYDSDRHGHLDKCRHNQQRQDLASPAIQAQWNSLLEEWYSKGL